MKQIVHIITRDKFTAGHVNFMQKYFPDYNQYFIIPDYYKNGQEEVIIQSLKQVLYCPDIKLIAFRKGEYRDILNHVDKIIIEGVFGIELALFFWPKKLLSRTFLQFLGAISIA